VLTIHNLAHQGLFGPESLAFAGLGPEHFAVDRLEFYGKASFLKAGILAADQLTTVSTTYAREILTPELGERPPTPARSSHPSSASGSTACSATARRTSWASSTASTTRCTTP
jgi:hypothetical protein